MAATYGIDGSITSWAGATNTGLISGGVSPHTASFQFSRDNQDTTPFNSGGVVVSEYTHGLVGGTGSVTCELNPATYGLNGLVTFTNNYVVGAKSWSLNINIPVTESTSFDAAGKEYKDFTAGPYNWQGQYVCNLDDATVMTLPLLAANTITLRYADAEVTPFALTGSARVENASPSSSPRSLAEITYAFRGTGALTSAGDDTGGDSKEPIFAAGALGAFAPGELVAVLTDGTTVTANAVPTSVQIAVSLNSPVQVTTNFQLSGTITPS